MMKFRQMFIFPIIDCIFPKAIFIYLKLFFNDAKTCKTYSKHKEMRDPTFSSWFIENSLLPCFLMHESMSYIQLLDVHLMWHQKKNPVKVSYEGIESLQMVKCSLLKCWSGKLLKCVISNVRLYLQRFFSLLLHWSCHLNWLYRTSRKCHDDKIE